MATAIITWVRRRPNAERCGRFRLSPGIIVPLHISTCTVRLSPGVGTRVWLREAVYLLVVGLVGFMGAGSLWLRLVFGSSSVTLGDTQIGAKWSQVSICEVPMVWPCGTKSNSVLGFSGTAGEPCHLSFPGVPPSRTSASAGTEGGLISDTLLAAHPRGWEHVGAPERALRGGSCFPRIPGSHCF